ncbi:Uncharacterized protein Rs2_10410 [Raphanus sativus]|nr:Uncharacterized protein Rs2_10410 [Raphanus sativus]
MPVKVPQRGKDLFPQRTQEVWRPKLVPAPEDPTNHAKKLRLAAIQNNDELNEQQNRRDLVTKETANQLVTTPGLTEPATPVDPSMNFQANPMQVGQVPNMEAMMEELQEVTRQYLNCPDPVEAAARKQRVLVSDANRLMEETTARLIATARNQQVSIMGPRSLESNPNTPPPLQEANDQEAHYPTPALSRSPLLNDKVDEDEDLDPYYIESYKQQ